MEPSERGVMGERPVQVQDVSGEESAQRQVTIDMLPDELLLEIFAFCRELSASDSAMDGPWRWETPWWWTIPVHVSRRWRNTIFGSSHRLDLRVTCDRGTFTRGTLDIWPPFPITIHHWHGIGIMSTDDGNCGENLAAALEHQDRIAELDLVNLLESEWEIIVAAMHRPLPALKHLTVYQFYEQGVLPEALVGVSAPQLRSFSSSGFSFRALPTLVLYAGHIVELHLLRIPPSGHVAPDMVSTWLEALPKLKHFSFELHSIEPLPVQRNPFSLTIARAVLPVLTSLSFEGHSVYLEDLVARIDTPLLSSLRLAFLDHMQHIPELYHFITRTERLNSFDRAQVVIHSSHVKVLLGQPTHDFDLEVKVYRSDRQVSWMAKVCGRFSPLLSCVERLDIRSSYVSLPHEADSAQWLEALRPFEGLQSLYVSKDAGPPVATALQSLTGGKATEVLPALRDLFFEGLEPPRSLGEMVQPFVAARQLSDRPVAVQGW